MDWWIYGWIDGLIGGWIYGWIDGWMVGCVMPGGVTSYETTAEINCNARCCYN
jgi:hypothetical protein